MYVCVYVYGWIVWLCCVIPCVSLRLFGEEGVRTDMIEMNILDLPI